MKNEFDEVLIAHVELSKARFVHGEEMGVEFRNEIDAWTKMEVVFRQQIKQLKECKTSEKGSNSRNRKNKGDLKTLCYSIRG
jgi:hypothetical protein